MEPGAEYPENALERGKRPLPDLDQRDHSATDEGGTRACVLQKFYPDFSNYSTTGESTRRKSVQMLGRTRVLFKVPEPAGHRAIYCKGKVRGIP